MRWTENPKNKVRVLKVPQTWVYCNRSKPVSKTVSEGSTPSTRADKILIIKRKVMRVLNYIRESKKPVYKAGRESIVLKF